jgi:3'-phosphoadenosine 5'-phosphosulfate sulfotransferase
MSDFEYRNNQVSEIYAKLEVAKMLIKLGTEMAEQATIDIQFYRITNDSNK